MGIGLGTFSIIQKITRTGKYGEYNFRVLSDRNT